ncbi:MAG: glycoside hydrolase family 3 protein [Deltaproteobacteria bacterium]|jgi:beta-N-acetylhexosaminidase|nr:glycoside hydrolase family 3 protein [Deltaproteobacteria bacterium]MBW2481929.1 glycoside hydrolase family 3 protein [Deltaproteobacteria bacterium]
MQTDTFSDKQLAGQRLMVGFDGPALNDDLKFLINEFKVGGVILFTINIESPDQIRDLCRSMQDYAQNCHQPPLFIAIDQEGGQVARLQAPFTIFPGNPHMKSEDDAIYFAKTTAAELNQVGINMNMAPVMDVSPANSDSIMAERTFGSDPTWVSRLGVKVIEHLQLNNIMAVAKHFPGIGRTTLDSHMDMPILHDDLSAIKQFDLIPFEAGILSGVSGVMLSHIFYARLDPHWPASLSPPIANNLLRHQMGFNGLVLTDDLDMGAIAKHYDMQTAIHQILASDIDLTLICHKGPNIEIAFEEILKGITDSDDLKTRGLASVERIMKAKRKYLFKK